MIESAYTAAADWYPLLQGDYVPVCETVQKIQADALEHAARLCGDKDRPRPMVVDALRSEALRLRTIIPT